VRIRGQEREFWEETENRERRRERRHIGRGQSREWSVRPNRWKEIYSSRALAAGLKYGVDVETPPLPLPSPPSPLRATPRRDALPGNTVELQRILSRHARYAGIGLEFAETLDAEHFFDGGRRRAESSRRKRGFAPLRYPVITTRNRMDGQDDSARAWWTFAFSFSLSLSLSLFFPPSPTASGQIEFNSAANTVAPKNARPGHAKITPRFMSAPFFLARCLYRIDFFLGNIRDAIVHY